MTLITVPDMDFSAFYYPEILRELLTYFRRNRSTLGLTDENEYEVHVQLLRAFALVGHLNNTRVDIVANELLYETARTLESIKRLLRLIGVELSSATPALAEVLLQLSNVTSTNQTGFIPKLAEFDSDSVPPIPYEVLQEGGYDLDRTDQVNYVYGQEKTANGIAQVSTASPDIIYRTSGTSFSSVFLNQVIKLQDAAGFNNGEFLVTEVISSSQVRVARLPSGKTPSFQTEENITWKLYTFTANYAANANTDSDAFSPWTTPEAGDALYLAHKHCMWNAIEIILDTAGSGIVGVWEYYDAALSTFNPTAITDNGDGTLTFDITTLVGALNRAGALVKVTCALTGQQEILTSYFSTTNKILTTGLLGQVTASLSLSDYTITAEWVPLDNLSDGSNNFTANGTVSFILPQTDIRSWQKIPINQLEAWWLRYRIVSVATPTSPSIDRLKINSGEQFLLIEATQGETIGPQVLGSSNGAANQEFMLPDTPFIDDTEVIEVNEGGGNWKTWTRVRNFLNSGVTNRHYTRRSTSADQAIITFGDGANGKIPSMGTDNIRATYRVGCGIDGNVGINEITSNADGLPGISRIYNPRLVTGWRVKEGGTELDKMRVKRDAPAQLRTRETGATVDDIQRLATAFKDSLGAKPVSRAVAVEEGLGPKTVKLLVVGSGNSTLTSEQKEELEYYFNGDRYARPPVSGKLILNHQLTVFNFEPKLVQINATVTWPGGNAESIRNMLLTILCPLALEADGATYTWDFDGYVSLSRIYSAIHEVNPNIEDVPSLLINGASSSLKLGLHELPISTASSITINVQ